MANASAFFTFLLALTVLQITPGPDMMLIMARGVGQGRKVALLAVVGMIFVSGVVQVGLLVLGLASLLSAYPAALIMLQWIGAIYLIYLGGRMIWGSFRKHSGAALKVKPASAWQAVREGAINNLTNPKSLLFMFAFLPQFVDPAAGPVWLQLLILGSIQKLMGLLSLGSVALAAGSVGHFLYRWPQLLGWQERFTGLVMIALGIRLLLSGHSGPAPAAAR
ncbi:UNVERIFIED_ORG: threonine/homoserine/homoserine lactone efflux protein [Rhizobium esperanzae]|uniref:LysE family translocator n=1 Tax=Rhizobium phaseoli TaxID=396 RepID=UPI00055B0B6A|nr:LysE family translocator [Rhizobium phaseoli]MDK4730236.1 LysE family translocator [Rhizobium phaseoli]NKE91439.1 LysE family translocator [Rhizobium phaseoli]PDS32609.1 LysE family translocator [Rhizobium phaseoli]PDS69365.1 LysE family translocator [Rhizobium phaseoli]